MHLYRKVISKRNGELELVVYSMKQQSLRKLYNRLLKLQHDANIDGEQVRQVMKQAYARSQSAKDMPRIIRETMQGQLRRKVEGHE